MSAGCVVLAHAPGALPGLPAGAEVRGWATAGELARLLESAERPVVLVSDGLHAEEEAVVAAAVRAGGQSCIEVRSGRWDGRTPSPVSAACRGVISGFGMRGVAAATRLLLSGPAAG